jgi:hypothetical protein
MGEKLAWPDLARKGGCGWGGVIKKIKFQAGRGGAFVISLHVPPKIMRLLSKILWFLAFLVATFCWMVLFEHGFSVKSFTEGVKQELAGWKAKVTGSAEAVPAPTVPPATATPKPAQPTKAAPPEAKKPGT